VDLRAELLRCIADPAVKDEILAKVDMRGELLRATGDPQVKRALVAAFSDLPLGELVAKNMDTAKLVNDPELRATVLSQIKHSLTEDAQLDRATLLCAGPVYVVLFIGGYIYTVAACFLTSMGFGMYFLMFITTYSFQFHWFHIFHIPHAILAVMVARRLPTPYKILKTIATPPPSKESSGSAAPVTGAPDAMAVLMGLCKPALKLMLPFLIVSACCLVTDFIAMIIYIVLFWKLKEDPILGLELAFEQGTLTLFAILSICYSLVDLAPLLTWPLLRWLLPPSYHAAIVNSIKAVLRKPKAQQGLAAADSASAPPETLVAPPTPSSVPPAALPNAASPKKAPRPSIRAKPPSNLFMETEVDPESLEESSKPKKRESMLVTSKM
jgi:hypothetical protein